MTLHHFQGALLAASVPARKQTYPGTNNLNRESGKQKNVSKAILNLTELESWSWGTCGRADHASTNVCAETSMTLARNTVQSTNKI